MAKLYGPGDVAPGLDAPAFSAAAVTPSDVLDLNPAPSRALWIGGAGNLNVVTVGGDTVLVSGIPAGTLLPLRVTRVLSTNTNATLIVAFY